MGMIDQGLFDGTIVTQGWASAAEDSWEPFEVSLWTYLKANLDQPVFEGHIPQNANAPVYSFVRRNEEALYYMRGAATGFVKYEFQIDCWSPVFSTAPEEAPDTVSVLTLERNLKRCLHGYVGPMGKNPRVTSRLLNSVTVPEPPVDGSDFWMCHRATFWRFCASEEVPSF